MVEHFRANEPYLSLAFPVRSFGKVLRFGLFKRLQVSIDRFDNGTVRVNGPVMQKDAALAQLL